MNKELKYDTLAALVQEYRDCYNKCWHKVLEVSVGLPFSHFDMSELPLQWKVLKLLTAQLLWKEIEEALIQYSYDNYHLVVCT